MSKKEKQGDDHDFNKPLEKAVSKKLDSDELKKEIEHQISEQLPEVVKGEVGVATRELETSIKKQAKLVADESFEDLKSKLERDRLNIIQATSIVTVFIGFLVVQFNILQGEKPTKEVAGLSLLLLSSVIVFVLLIDLVVNLRLPLKKRRFVNGGMSALAKLAKPFSYGRYEEIELSWKPNTWGPGLVVRMIALMFTLILVVLGTVLIAI